MACHAALLWKRRRGREVWALGTARSLARAQAVLGQGGQEPCPTDRGFLVSLPRVPAPQPWKQHRSACESGRAGGRRVLICCAK